MLKHDITKCQDIALAIADLNESLKYCHSFNMNI